MQAQTDCEGRFDLFFSVDNGTEYLPGAPAGKYAVTIAKMPVSSDGSRARPKHLLPRKYTNTRSSGLSAVVSPDSPNNFAFELSD